MRSSIDKTRPIASCHIARTLEGVNTNDTTTDNNGCTGEDNTLRINQLHIASLQSRGHFGLQQAIVVRIKEYEPANAALSPKDP